MKNKYWFFIVIIIIVGIILAYLFKPVSMNDIYNKPNFIGVVTEVHDKDILVFVNKDEDEFKSSDKISVSLDVKLKDSTTSFSVGDTVRVFYNGEIAESYPARVSEVYAILLVKDF